MSLREDVDEVKRNIDDIRKNSLALDIISGQEKKNQRQFVIIIILLFMLFAETCYLIYVLNDIMIIEEDNITEVTQSDAENNNFIGNDGTIINGSENQNN